MSEEITFFELIDAFETLSQGVLFSANERSLFYALAYSWNKAHRPAVIEQWLDTTSAKSSLDTRYKLASARNGLVQKGVIFFGKNGNRGVPRYSFNALFGLPDPCLLEKTDTKISSNTLSNTSSKVPVTLKVKSPSYKRESTEKEKGNGPECIPDNFPDSRQSSISPPSSGAPPSLPDLINSLYPDWKGMQWTSAQGHELLEVQESFRDYPFDLVRAYLATDPGFVQTRTNFVRDQGRYILGRAKTSGVKTSSGPSWLPANWRDIATQISGRDCSNLREWTQISPDYRPDFERECKKKAA